MAVPTIEKLRQNMAIRPSCEESCSIIDAQLAENAEKLSDADIYFACGYYGRIDKKLGTTMHYFRKSISNIDSSKDTLIYYGSPATKIIIMDSIEHGKFDNLKNLTKIGILDREIFIAFNEKCELIDAAMRNFLSGDYMLVWFIENGFLKQSDCSDRVTSYILFKCLRRAGPGSCIIILENFIDSSPISLECSDEEFIKTFIENIEEWDGTIAARLRNKLFGKKE